MFDRLSISIKLAQSALKAKKSRTILTMLGISIGIAVVVAIMAAGRGLDYMVMGQLEVFGSDTISIEVKVPSTKQTSSENSMGRAQGITITTLNEKDRDDVGKNPNIVAAYGYQIGQEVLSYQGQTKKVLIAGEGYQMGEVEKFDLAEGRLYSKDEEDSLSQVLVIGSNIKEKFFGDDSAVGRVVYVKGKPFRVVGVAAKRGSAAFMNLDDFVYMPVKTLQKRLMGIDYYTNIMAKIKDMSQVNQTVTELGATIRENHDITDPEKDDFAINTMEEAATMLKTVVNGIVLLLVALVCVSLVVGGVGIMNIMYVSVTERVFEIGLRKSLGASREDILWQFLAEAILLTLGGSVFGIVLGIIFSFAIYYIALAYGLSWIFSIPLGSIFLAIGFSATVGLVFGIYPAKKAAALDPIEALRRE